MRLTISDLISIREDLKDVESTIGSYYDSRLNNAKSYVSDALDIIDSLITVSYTHLTLPTIA